VKYTVFGQIVNEFNGRKAARSPPAPKDHKPAGHRLDIGRWGWGQNRIQNKQEETDNATRHDFRTGY
jgi:hypothetical protein